jgi:hypothetical protein
MKARSQKADAKQGCRRRASEAGRKRLLDVETGRSSGCLIVLASRGRSIEASCLGRRGIRAVADWQGLDHGNAPPLPIHRRTPGERSRRALTRSAQWAAGL